jgi:hypothetical protein
MCHPGRENVSDRRTEAHSMTPREIESERRIEALKEALGAPLTSHCTGCTYIALYIGPKRVHERTAGHIMKESE